MDGPLRAAVALAVVLSVSAVAPVGSGPAAASATATPVVSQQNTTSYLSLPDGEVRATRYDAVTLDTAGSVALDGGKMRARYLTVRIGAAFKNASTAAERRAALNESAERIETRIRALHQRERAALRALNRGEISTGSYVRELAAIHAEASALRTTVRTLVRYNRVADKPLSSTRLARMKVQLLPLYGPVRDRVATAMRDESTDATRVFVETSNTGVVLGTVVQDEFSTQFVREAYWGGGFDPTGPLTTDFSAARERFRANYSWVFDVGQTQFGLLTSPPNYASAGVFGLRASHPHGTTRQYHLISYMDGHTGEVFREMQYKDVTALPTHAVANTTTDGLRLRVEASHATGPMLVNVTDAGRPVDATVYVNGQTVADTGDDGELWTVAPRAGFNVTVAAGNRTVTATPRAGR